MNIKEIEAVVLSLVPKDRARLAEKLLESLEDLTDEENQIIWAKEAEIREENWSQPTKSSRNIRSVLKNIRSSIR